MDQFLQPRSKPPRRRNVDWRLKSEKSALPTSTDESSKHRGSEDGTGQEGLQAGHEEQGLWEELDLARQAGTWPRSGDLQSGACILF